ncbi:MAG: hypothetical protein KGI41_00560 [Patescibacteria group bacterium]|nr:hypothetical protein [Patescibacteria group bacterium]MDE1965720.1 hypothetical protein [Patescibacteria group bacterium]
MSVTHHISLGDLSVAVTNPITLSAMERNQYEAMIAHSVIPRLHAEMCRSSRRTFSRDHLGMPSPVLRVELASYDPDASKIIEVEQDGSGLGIARKLGLPLADNVAYMLYNYGVREIGYYRSACREHESADQEEMLDAFTRQGICVRRARSLDELSPTCPSWIHASHGALAGYGEQGADAAARAVFWPFDDGGSKRVLLFLNAYPLSNFRSAEELYRMFPDGFVVKPFVGRSARFVRCFEPPIADEYGSDESERTELGQVLADAKSGTHLVQPLLKHPTIREHGKKRHEVAVLFFVFIEGYYRLRAGYFMNTPSRKVHVGACTHLRPIRC